MRYFRVNPARTTRSMKNKKYLQFKFITPSSAAVFKMWFYGILLRSKTIQLRLKNCPTQARSAGVMLQRLVIYLNLAHTKSQFHYFKAMLLVRPRIYLQPNTNTF